MSLLFSKKKAKNLKQTIKPTNPLLQQLGQFKKEKQEKEEKKALKKKGWQTLKNVDRVEEHFEPPPASDEEEESDSGDIPLKYRQRMRNKGHATQTSCGPNSYGKDNGGFLSAGALRRKRQKEIEDQFYEQDKDLINKSQEQYSQLYYHSLTSSYGSHHAHNGDIKSEEHKNRTQTLFNAKKYDYSSCTPTAPESKKYTYVSPMAPSRSRKSSERSEGSDGFSSKSHRY